ncbi:serine/threonine-protein kinase [Streptomyces sp. NPDC051561]|uniref:serine/threonine-protein kinase n=1 Tax=Streptomyces sp. NPDC051561 TaxID=3365658 RepID=UPI0037924E5E
MNLTTPLTPQDPTHLGPYQLLGVLGAGGMGTVYLGRTHTPTSLRPPHLAAVKTLRPELARDPHLLSRFRREIEAATAARSPYVAKVLAHDLTTQPPWFAGEFVPGPTLSTAVDSRGPLPEPAVRALAAALARALATLHEAGVVHRDLKPSNVLLASDGPRVVDFGIARTSERTALTVTGQNPGSPGYMSPEQVLGGEIGPPNDVFVLGSLLAYAAGGHHAFGSDFSIAAFAIAHEEPDLSRVPHPLRPLLASCLAKDPAARPTARQLSEQLPELKPRLWLPAGVAQDIAALETRTVEVTGLRPGDTRARHPLTRRGLLIGLGSAALLAAAGTATVRLLPDDAPATLPLWTGAQDTVPPAAWQDEHADPKAEFGPTTTGNLVLIARTGRTVAALDPLTGAQRWTYRYGAGGAPVPAPHPYVLDSSSRLVRLDPETGKPHWQEQDARNTPSGLTCILAADQDTVYALTRTQRIVAISAENGTHRWQYTAPAGTALATAGGTRLLVAAKDGRVHAFDTTDGRPVWQHRTSTEEPQQPCIAGTLALLSGKLLWAGDLLTGTQKWTAEANGGAGPFVPSPFGPPAAADGRCYLVDNSEIRAFDLADGKDVWSHDSVDPLDSATPLLAAGGVYVPVDDAATVIALDRTTGNARYRATAGSTESWRGTTAAGAAIWQRGSVVTARPAF